MKAQIHHVALKVKDLKKCSDFYKGLFNLPVIKYHKDKNGNKRSVWFQCKNFILMLEKCNGDCSNKSERGQHSAENHGWYLLAFDISAKERKSWKRRLEKTGIKIEEESRYSLFFKDPEGNRLAVSHYPVGVNL